MKKTEQCNVSKFKKHLKALPALLSISTIVIFFIILVGSMLTPHSIYYYFNPDLNTDPFMMKNLIYQGGCFFDWHMGSAIYLVPELVLLYITTHLFSNPFTDLILNAIFQIAFFSLITIATFYAATKTKSGFRLGFLSILIFFIALLILQKGNGINSSYGDFAYLSAIFGLGFHFGTALMTFTAFFLFLCILSVPKLYLKILFICSLILSGLSDPLFYIYLTLPLFATVSIGYFSKTLTKKDCLFFLSSLISCFIISYTVYRLLPFQDSKINTSISFHLSYAYGFLKTLIVFVQQNTFGGILWLLFFILAPFSLWYSFSKKNKQYRLINYVILFQWLTILLVTPIIILTIGQILPGDYDIISSHSILSHPINSYNQLELLPYRYLINYFIGPTCIGFPLLFYKHTKGFALLNKDGVYTSLLIICIGLILLYKPHHLFVNNLFTFQPKLVVCFDHIAKKEHLSNGIANSYYAETLINAYNTNYSHIALVNNDLTPLS